MADEKKEEAMADASAAPTASKEGEKLDLVLKHLDSLHKRMDAYESMAKPDAEMPDKEQERSDEEDCAADSEEEEKGAEGKSDGEGDNAEEALAEERESNSLKKNDKARKDSKRMRKDSKRKDSDDEEEGEEMRGDSRADAAELRRMLADMEKRIPVEMPEADRTRFVDAQAQAERVAQAFGDSAGAPRWLNGETLSQYRKRLLTKVKHHSAAWKDVDLSPMADEALAVVERQVYSDAMNAALRPTSVEGGMLRQVVETDATGRRITKFFGDPEACWGPFKQPTRRIASWNTKP